MVLESGGQRLLIDCGLFQGYKQLRLRNWNAPPFKPEAIDAVLLTHAHFDHFHKPSIRKLPAPKIGVMPWGMGELARGLGFERMLMFVTGVGNIRDVIPFARTPGNAEF